MPLSRGQKVAQSVSVRESFDKAVATVLVDYRGVNVAMMTDLRARFREAGVVCQVVKNNVIRKALEGSELGQNEEFCAHLRGPVAVAWSFEDPSVAAKVIKSFRKDFSGELQPKEGAEKLVVKCGVVDGQVLDAQRVERDLALLPGKDDVRAFLLAVLTAPMQKLIAQISTPARKLTLALEAKRRLESPE